MTHRDRRDEILSRLDELLSGLVIPLLGGVNGAVTINGPAGQYVRNRNELPADKVPGIILLDADEVRNARAVPRERGLQERVVPPQMMCMTPEIYVVLDVRGIGNKNVGEDLNTARMHILSTVLQDQTLQSIVGANGNIWYDGSVTDLARNRTMKGQLGISLTFCYPLMQHEYAID